MLNRNCSDYSLRAQGTHCIAQLGGNVFELDTDCRSCAMAGHAIFNARIKIDLPKRVDFDVLISSLHELSDDLMVDIEE